MDLLSKASTIAMLAFVISSMLAMGVGLSISQIIQPLRNPQLVVFALLSNFVLMPLCAYALSTLLRLDQPLGVGMLLLGCAAGAPFLPKLAELAKGNLPFAVGTMVLDGCHSRLSAGGAAAPATGCCGQSGEDRAVTRPAHAAAARHRACPEVAL
ncbi:MAG: bile acid:sodium symporter [Hyphomicrobiaceae bacterium]